MFGVKSVSNIPLSGEGLLNMKCGVWKLSCKYFVAWLWYWWLECIGLVGWRTSKFGESIVRMVVGLCICIGMTYYFHPLESYQTICLTELPTSRHPPLQINCWYNRSSDC